MKKLLVLVLFLPCFIFSQNDGVEISWSPFYKMNLDGDGNKLKASMVLVTELNKDEVKCLSVGPKDYNGKEYVFKLADLKATSIRLHEFTNPIPQVDYSKATDYNANEGQVEVFSDGLIFFYDSAYLELDKDDFLAKYPTTKDKQGRVKFDTKSMSTQEKLAFQNEMLKSISGLPTEESSKKIYTNDAYEKVGMKMVYQNKELVNKEKLLDAEEVKLQYTISSYTYIPPAQSGELLTHKELIIEELQIYQDDHLIASFPKYFSDRFLPNNSIFYNHEDKEIYVVHVNTYIEKEGVNKRVNLALLTIVNFNGEYHHYELEGTEKENQKGLYSYSIHPIYKNAFYILEQRADEFRVGYVNIY